MLFNCPVDEVSEIQIVDEVVDLNYLVDNLMFGIVTSESGTHSLTVSHSQGKQLKAKLIPTFSILSKNTDSLLLLPKILSSNFWFETQFTQFFTGFFLRESPFTMLALMPLVDF